MATITDKLKIKPGMTLLTINAPGDFKEQLEGCCNVNIVTKGNDYQQVHWFVVTKGQLEKEISRVLKLSKEGMVVWVYYPKGTSGIQTDLTRDKGWDCLLMERNKLTWIGLISFNEIWSVFGFRPKTAADKKKEARPKEREIFNWVNPRTKEITLPADLAAALTKNNLACEFFKTLSFTNKKEYLEWIVTARRQVTRTQRVDASIEKLAAGWKNPRNL